MAKKFCHSVEEWIREPQNESSRADFFCKNRQEEGARCTLGTDRKVQYRPLELQEDY